MTSLSPVTPELAVNHIPVLPSRSGRQIFGKSKEVDWAIGGAALGFTVAIVEYIANNVFDRYIIEIVTMLSCYYHAIKLLISCNYLLITVIIVV